jgi:hypothetical protein
VVVAEVVAEIARKAAGSARLCQIGVFKLIIGPSIGLTCS